ncbi:FAD-dependent oxidoreductase [Zhongshania sp. BJYM1]|uniref:FAD-dependent oxidoreductase n=1 Tax=Zhongshania aquatica TaxID=2965069 RepID=UPI0022B4D8D9|nr:FAD-dependent oxidoreductase [Marortus sp. BJYM1]
MYRPNNKAAVINTQQYVILVGGGHAHVQVIKQWGLHPIAGVTLTLISPQSQTPYSGMLPGLVAGHYTANNAHIDLLALCQFAGVIFIQDEVAGINITSKELHLRGTDHPIRFDVLSINSGITPNLVIPGAAQFVTPVKPISEFYPRWQETLKVLSTSITPQSIAVVGGGAAGVELILAMRHAISQCTKIDIPVTLQLVYRGDEPLMDFPARIKKLINTALVEAGIQLYKNRDVYELSLNTIHCKQNPDIHSDHIFWCTNAKAPEWPQESGLDIDKNGFISVKDTLQSSSHDFIFAAGDVAQQYNHPRPHAGVFAVRQGPILFTNLQRKLKGQSLIEHRPQKHFLSILAIGGKRAIAYRRFWPALQGKWVWHWKNSIDKRFMMMFVDLD